MTKRVMMCGVCTELYDVTTMQAVRHDGIATTVVGDGQNRVGVTQVQEVTYRCNRCTLGIPASRERLSVD